MTPLVLKFGGNCLATPEKILERAQQIIDYTKGGRKVIVVVSAMGRTTNNLVDLAYSVSKNPIKRELDMLLTTGERVSMSLLSMVLNDLSCPAISFTGSQAGILTQDDGVNTQIYQLRPIRVEEELNNGKVVVLAGFQGVDPQSKEIKTLGRGGSDTTAIFFANYFKGECLIFKDVPGVCNCDPNIFNEASTFSKITHDQLDSICRFGGRILHLPAIDLAKKVNLDFDIVYADKPLVTTKIVGENITSFKALTIAKQTFKINLSGERLLDMCKSNGLVEPHYFEYNGNSVVWGELEILNPLEQIANSKETEFTDNGSLLTFITSEPDFQFSGDTQPIHSQKLNNLYHYHFIIETNQLPETYNLFRYYLEK